MKDYVYKIGTEKFKKLYEDKAIKYSQLLIDGTIINSTLSPIIDGEIYRIGTKLYREKCYYLAKAYDEYVSV